jgi:pentatricopeptide repeat protein
MQFRLIPYRIYCTSVAISSTSQISRYARIGQIENARRLFDQMHDKSIVVWNSIVAGYFQNSQPREARILFDRMPERNTVGTD